MWTRAYKKTFKDITRDDIWRIWIDVNNWPLWHDDLEWCTLEGKFEVGNHFFLKPQGIKPVKIEITEMNEGYSFTDCTSFFGAKMYDTHAMIDTTEGLEISNTLVVTGPLKGLWIKLVAQNVANTVPGEIESLVKLVRGNND